MLSASNLTKIRDLLEESQNPLFFYDNDVDGLASFLLLSRFLKRGKGVVIKSYPDLGVAYIRKLHEIKSDSVFILDKPIVSQEFFEACFQLGLPVTWIDHHPPQEKIPEEVEYFNPLNAKKATSEPTSFLCYQATKRKEDDWIALLGCVADYYLPDFAQEFAKKYPDLLAGVTASTKADRILFETQLGKLVKILSFSLKDSTSNVLRMMRFMLKAQSPYELLNKENKDAEFIYSRYERINRKFVKLMDKAKRVGSKSGRVLFFTYSGDLSISAELSNELQYCFPNKMIVVVYLTGTKANVSLRDTKLDLRAFLDKVMKGIEGTYGGHKAACGSAISAIDLDNFKEKVFKAIR